MRIRARLHKLPAPKGTGISKKDFVVLKQLFEEMDRTGDGFVNLEEYKESVLTLKPSLSHRAVADMFRAMTLGHDDVDLIGFVKAAYPLVDEQRIRQLAIRVCPPELSPVHLSAVEKMTDEQKDEVRAIVHCWDDDGDGKISKYEMRRHCVRAEVPDEMIDHWFKQYDVGNKGDLTVDEVIACLAETYNEEDR